MEFFENDLVSEVAQNHIQDVRGLEDREAEKILKLYKRVRQDLRDRLEVIPNGSFSAQKMRGALTQVELGINEMTKILGEGMKDSAQPLAESGIDNLVEEIRLWDKEFTGAVIPINLDAVKVASDTSNFLFNRYEASLKNYNEILRSKFASLMTEGVIAEKTTSEVISEMGKVFLGEEWRLHMIARTELHNVYNVAKINGMKDLVGGDIPDLKKTLFHPMDRRTGEDSIRLSKKNPIVPVDEPFIESSTGKKLVYMSPPNRPNDRSILIPYREAWG